MNHEEHSHPPRQIPLTLGSGAQWQQLPQDVRDRCRALVVQLLTHLARSQAAGGDDDE